ncbi:uncharacterized protein A1O9_08155 [Exophiala aquamarina CBS 119918]|uniref:Uncharacterized protein n=1 Tax=Exophiala aquamarina CBS 119918 TaxID=1182545 RepID=A0A072PIR6_9EURO|nr:uncharacterized protein A1O9_08155 [Exophiala aquamarina CBS 119918]KEF55405.1 hypothetical protein A1O9_08155 [Exophiala aquamarina CBS 119918]
MAAEIDSLWQAAFGSTSRPALYTSEELNEDGFLPLSEPSSFLMNISNLNRQQLYAASSNNQIAMKSAQDEYLDLERQINRIKGKSKFKNPQQLPPPDVFEEQKEAVLYNYKYEPNKPALLQSGIPGLRAADEVTDREKHDVRLAQEPFEQGGFVPKEKEYKAMHAKARNPKNADGWTPISKDGKGLIPMQQTHKDEYNIKYNTNNNKANGDVNFDGARPQSAGTDASANTPSKAVDKRLTRTRYDGKKVPATRDVSEAPSVASTPGRKRESTPLIDGREDTPNSKRRKLNGPDKPKHPNQYTKAREAREAKEARESAVVNTTAAQATPKPAPANVDWTQLSPTELQNRKWTDEELVEAVKQTHSWLHDDAKKAEEWKHKIINGVNPVRSFSMFRKWAYWKVNDQDKRPRNKKNLADGDLKDSQGQKASPKPRRSAKAKLTAQADSARTTPSASPVPEMGNGLGLGLGPGSQELKRAPGPRGGLNRKAALGNKSYKSYEESITDDEIQSASEKDEGSRGAIRGSRKAENDASPGPIRRPTLDREESDSIIVVNGATPTRRSLRNSRRASG